MHSTTTRENVLCSSGNQSLVAAGTTICTLTPAAQCDNCGMIARPTVQWNILPGQYGIFAVVDTSGVNDIAIDPTQSGYEDSVVKGEFYIALGVDTTGDGNTDKIYKGTNDWISHCDITYATAKAYTAPEAMSVDILFDCTQCDEKYGIKVQSKDMKYRQYFGPERYPIDDYLLSTDCYNCTECSSQHNCDEIYDLLECEYIKKNNIEAPHNEKLYGQWPPYNISKLTGTDLEERDCDDNLVKTWSCGIRFTGIVDGRKCHSTDPNLNRVRNQGTTLELFPGIGWDNGKNFTVRKNNHIVLEDGNGDWLMWREIISNQHVAGTDFYLDTDDMVNPYPYTELKDTAQCKCQENYCQIILDYRNSTHISATQSDSVNTGRMVLAVPNSDDTTKQELQDAINGILAALNKPLMTLSC